MHQLIYTFSSNIKYVKKEFSSAEGSQHRKSRDSLKLKFCALFDFFKAQTFFFFGDHMIFYFAHTKQALRANVDRMGSICKAKLWSCVYNSAVFLSIVCRLNSLRLVFTSYQICNTVLKTLVNLTNPGSSCDTIHSVIPKSFYFGQIAKYQSQ